MKNKNNWEINWEFDWEKELKKSKKSPYDDIKDDSIKNWVKEWIDRTSQVKYENSFNEKSDEWIEIDGIGRFKGLQITSEQHSELNKITINFKYDEWDKNK